jgi:hypothetical protein
MSNHKFPAFQFYPKDWLSSESVICMSAEQRGWYIQLLCYAWQGEPGGSLPAADRKLKALAGAGDKKKEELQRAHENRNRPYDFIMEGDEEFAFVLELIKKDVQTN